MLVPILALVACEVDLTLTAGAIGIGMRRSSLAATVAATGLISSVFAAAIFLVWILWFVAPACVAGGQFVSPPRSFGAKGGGCGEMQEMN